MTFNSITFLIFFAIVVLLLLITKIDFKIKKEKIKYYTTEQSAE